MATYQDELGNAFSASSAATAAAIQDFVGGFLAYEPRALGVVAAADADPGNALAQVYAAAVQMFAETPDAPRQAEPYLRRAEAAVRPSDRRVAGLLAFTQAWAEERLPEALAIGDDVLAEHPRDLALVKLHQYLNFNLGRFPEMLRIARQVEHAAGDSAALHGMKSFALEQCHLVEEAEGAARTALRLSRREPWAQHTLAHVALGGHGRVADGAAFLESMEDGWSGLNSFMSTHLYWHLGLFYLSQGREADLLHLYDRHVWGVAPDYSQDQVNAISLLARMEMAGIAVGDRWQALAPYLAGRADDTVLPFLSLQYLYGLARAGRAGEAETLLAAVRSRAETAPDFVRATWRDVAVPAAEGVLAHATGDMEGAARSLARALPRLERIGGSHAQRDLFELMELDALQRSGRWGAARERLERRRRFDPDGKPLNRSLALACDRLGLPEEAALARGRL